MHSLIDTEVRYIWCVCVHVCVRACACVLVHVCHCVSGTLALGLECDEWITTLKPVWLFDIHWSV